MGDMNFSIWMATIKGRQYVYFRNGSRKTRYLGPLEAVRALAGKLTGKGINKAAMQLSAIAKTTFDEARELVKGLREFMAELKAKVRKDLEAGEVDSFTIARAVTLEMAAKGYSNLFEMLWSIIEEHVRRNEIRARELRDTVLRTLKKLVEE